MPSKSIDVVFWVNKSNTFGLSKDVEVFQYLFKTLNKDHEYVLHFHTKDPLEPPIPADINVHIEIPVYVAVPWAQTNLWLVNPEWYTSEWDGYVSRFQALIVRDKTSAHALQQKFPTAAVRFIPWCLPPQEPMTPPKKQSPISIDSNDGFVWFVAGSKNKRSAVEWLVPHWKAEYPPLTICSIEPFTFSTAIQSNVKFITKDLSKEERKDLIRRHPGQVCLSTAEAYGYAAAEAMAAGCFPLLNRLDAYLDNNIVSSSFPVLDLPLVSKGIARVVDLSGAFPEAELEQLLKAFRTADLETIRDTGDLWAADQRDMCIDAWESKGYWKELMSLTYAAKTGKPKHLPPVLMPDDCPPISVITLLYNRRKFFDLACHNIMLSDYPKDKIEWIVVEDSDDPNEDASDRVVQVGLKAAPLQLSYVPLDKKTPIGEKRNKGIERAKHDIILFMDDDDHYPTTSFRRRVAWLTKHPMTPQCVGCTTIAAYDLIRGVSAVNTPPYGLSLGKRISEATLCFYRSWWSQKKFPNEQLSEGEKFLEGREAEVLELPPQQIIVAFSHKKNTSGRRIPADDAKPGCFWGFPKEYLIYIHDLAGIKVEEE
jgi:hypothetical protein